MLILYRDLLIKMKLATSSRCKEFCTSIFVMLGDFALLTKIYQLNRCNELYHTVPQNKAPFAHSVCSFFFKDIEFKKRNSHLIGLDISCLVTQEKHLETTIYTLSSAFPMLLPFATIFFIFFLVCLSSFLSFLRIMTAS